MTLSQEYDVRTQLAKYHLVTTEGLFQKIMFYSTHIKRSETKIAYFWRMKCGKLLKTHVKNSSQVRPIRSFNTLHHIKGACHI